MKTTLIVLAIFLGLLVTFMIIYIILNFDNIFGRNKKKLIPTQNINYIENIPSKYYKDYYKDAEFINKNCIDLKRFVINDNINSYDLVKLTELNGIRLQVSEGWHSLLIELIKDLNSNGWDKKVTCIKEKYAALKFYTNHEYSSNIYNIIAEYEKKSEQTCETCGEKGKIRYGNGWMYVACRKHYLESRNKISIIKNGFNYNGNLFYWKDIRKMYFESLNFGKYNLLVIEFYSEVVKIQNLKSKLLYIYRDTVGFGKFLKYLNDEKNGKDLRYIEVNSEYLKFFQNSEFCEICGYEAVYYNECECCENDSWIGSVNKWKDKENNEEQKIDYIKYNQMEWIEDEGEKYELQQLNYKKKPNFKLLFTNEEYEAYINEDEQ